MLGTVAGANGTQSGRSDLESLAEVDRRSVGLKPASGSPKVQRVAFRTTLEATVDLLVEVHGEGSQSSLPVTVVHANRG